MTARQIRERIKKREQQADWQNRDNKFRCADGVVLQDVTAAHFVFLKIVQV